LQAAQEQLQKKNQELVDLYREKSKKLTQMTNLYNLLKARAMKSRMETAASENVSQTLNTISSRTGPTMPPAQSGTSMPNIQKARTPKTPSFPFSPEGVEQLHRYQRSGTGSSKMSRPQMGGGKSAMPPPTGHAVFNIRTGESQM
jgi:E3 ubiquitin-protein ligase CCNP1IP1